MKNVKDRKIINSVNLYSDTDFPYLVLNVMGRNSYPRNAGFKTVHWHEDVQFVFVLGGMVAVKTMESSITLKKGEGIFINKNVVHFIDSDGGRYNSFVFPDCFLKFYFGSPAEHLVNRIVGRGELPICIFSPSLKWHRSVLRNLKFLSALEQKKDELYPYRVLCVLSSLWLILLEHISLPERRRESIASVRMKLFLEYIHGHFAEPLSLDDVAKSANVSVSEVLRDFKLCMQTTPYKYITELRLQKAAALLKETDEPIKNIPALIGFSSASHFGKCFRERTGCSPKEYRNGFVRIGRVEPDDVEKLGVVSGGGTIRIERADGEAVDFCNSFCSRRRLRK
ncbi:MAG: helix-turn-helix transcriptional regulator [Treponema sp.]|nr:helix-turn-helix transcriptional regulator [Treponema sp.]